MVSKITIFEPHFDGAQFGPAARANEDPAAESGASEGDSERRGRSRIRGRSRGRSALVVGCILAGMLVGMTLVRRRLATREEPGEIGEHAAGDDTSPADTSPVEA